MDTVSVGCDRLDALLGGGVPRERSLLVTGSPGTGKTTVGMQFLQAGLDAGDECLLVSTEQTVAELEDTFEPYPFDVAAPNLTVVTINAESGVSIEEEGDLVVRTLEGGRCSVTEWFDLPFTRENVVQYLSEYRPTDRVLLDSVSGIRPMADDRVSFWRSTYNLIRLFSDDFGATAVLTAQGNGTEETVASDLISYATHGVLELDWGTVKGQRHRFARVTKMRGLDHDDRRHKLLLTEDGVVVRPNVRTQAVPALDYEHLSTGIDSFDDLLGGGLVRGGFGLLRHDGTTGFYTINARLLVRAVEAGMTVAVALPSEISLDRLDQYWADVDWTVDELLAADRLIVLELAGQNGRTHRNVLRYDPGSGRDWERLMELSYDRSGDNSLLAFVDTEPLLQTVSEQRVREVRYRAATNQSGDDDVVVYTVNPRMHSDEFVAFLVDSSQQTLSVNRDDDGLEWISLEKSPTGHPGDSRMIAYEADPPYVDLV